MEKFDKSTEQQKEEITALEEFQNLHCPKGAKFTIRADFLVKENYLVLGLLFWISPVYTWVSHLLLCLTFIVWWERENQSELDQLWSHAQS